MAATRDEIVNQISPLAGKLRQHNIRVNKVVLFGSYAKGTAREDSNIDVAIISDDFEGVRFLDRQKINPYLINQNFRFDIHPYRTGEFNPSFSWFVKEILKDALTLTSGLSSIVPGLRLATLTQKLLRFL
jgi:predicted nucleotidyltransferase